MKNHDEQTSDHDFRRDVGSNMATSSSMGPSGPTDSSRWEVTDDEVQIAFKRIEDGPISLTIDDRDFGTLSPRRQR